MVMLGLALVETIPQGIFEVKQAYNILCGFELLISDIRTRTDELHKTHEL